MGTTFWVKMAHPLFLMGRRYLFGKALDRKQHSNLVFANRFHRKRENAERNYQRIDSYTQFCRIKGFEFQFTLKETRFEKSFKISIGIKVKDVSSL